MGYSPRRFQSKSVYEITIRTLRGLPFTCSPLMKLVIESAIARANRDEKVKISHYLFMANHAHIMLVCLDQQGLSNFVGEVKKKITDSMKRLFGREQLLLWERRSSIAEIATYEDLVQRLQYFYLNPQEAGLIQDINSYPGLSTWQDFRNSEDTLDANAERHVPWLPATYLPRIPPKPDDYWGIRVIRRLSRFALEKEKLVVYPNLCLEAFDRTAKDVGAFKESVRKGVQNREALLAKARLEDGRKVLGRTALLQQRPTLEGWRPKRRERRIFLICSDENLRKELLKQYKGFHRICRHCYEMYLRGYRDVEWPPGAFQPPLPRLYNWLAGLS